MHKFLQLFVLFVSLIVGVFIGAIYRLIKNKIITEPIIEFKKTVCLGACPVYSVKIYDNGYISYIGESHVPIIGQKSGYINKEDLDRIIIKADAIDFFNLDNTYDGNVTDLPSTFITINLNGKKKTVHARYEYPDQLSDLMSLVHDIIIKNIS